MTDKEKIEKGYNYFISCIESASEEIDAIKGESEKFTELQLLFLDTLQNTINHAKKQMQETINGTVWDHLVIAFFGETNAGKSTIIETFRILFDKNKEKGNDGLIVGDGQSDFTKVYEEYNMTIQGLPFTLIDVPGIEGNETEEFKTDIQNALRQAHCVFYVQGHNKQPDRGTAEKIKQYLSDWVSVYSVYNVRGGEFNYDEEEERVNLYTPEVNTTERLIENTFIDILGKDIYKGNISVQALLAMCAIANFAKERDDLKETQKNLRKYFGKDSNIYDFSKMSLLTSLVGDMAGRFSQEITESNKQKLMSLARKSFKDINRVIDDNMHNSRELYDALYSFKGNVGNIMNGTKHNIRSAVQCICQELHDGILLEGYSLIENDGIKDKKEAFRLRVDNRKQMAEKAIRNRISSILKATTKSIEQEYKKLEGIKQSFVASNRSFNVDVQVGSDKALKEMDVQWSDVGDFVLRAGGMALTGSLWGPWGAVIGGAIGTILYILDKLFFGDGGKSRAKEELKKEIDDVFSKQKPEVEAFINQITKELDGQKRKMYGKINKELANIHQLEEVIDTTKEQIKKYVNSIKTKEYGNL